MNTVLPCAVMLFVVLSGVPGFALERLVLYDDFNAGYLHPDRWGGGEFSPAPPPRQTPPRPPGSSSLLVNTR
jgi:hypothetical protein